MYVPKYFTLQECFPPEMLASKKANWGLMDERILESADKLREIFGPLLCNMRMLRQCGFRTNGSLTSQHRFGRGMDLHTSNYSYFEIRKYILEHPEMFPYITFLEADCNWLHLDVRNCKPVTLWSPKRGYLTKKEYLKL